MSRLKERVKIIHEPSTHEIFSCLSSSPSYSKLLIEHNAGKLYNNFLSWLIDKDFYKDDRAKLTIKKIAAAFKSDPAKVTKWIQEIYFDIFDLNNDNPELFQKAGTKVTLYMKYYDNASTFYTSLPAVPRQFETIRYSFVKAKMGIDHFWVKKVDHTIENNQVEITLWLKGGLLNKYREFALDLTI